MTENQHELSSLSTASGVQYPFASLGSLSYTRYMTSLSFLKKLYLHILGMRLISKIKWFVHGISSCYLFELSDKYFKMFYPMDISITNIIKMFVHGISVPYLFELSDKYFEMSYPIDFSITNVVSGISLEYIHSIPPRAPAASGALLLLRARVGTAFFAALHHCNVQLLSSSH